MAIARSRRRPAGSQFVWIIFGCLALEALAAYSILIPLPYFGYILAVCAAVLLLSSKQLRMPPTGSLIIAFIALALFVTLFQFMTEDYSGRMPLRATLSYPAFIAVRYFILLGFISLFFLTYSLALRGRNTDLIAGLFVLATGLSIVAIYIYFAQKNGLWEPPRTRMGTGGQDFSTQSVTFNYAFHRALGTFREPGHLAQWLVAPFLLAAFGWSRFPSELKKLAAATWASTGVVLLMTGSLLGVLSVLLACLYYASARAGYTLKYVLISAPMLFACGIILASLGLFDGAILATTYDRLTILFEGGVAATNRGEAWDYILNHAPPITGYGLGNANIVLSEVKMSALMASHLSLFTNAYFSIGPIGLIMVVWFVAAPLLHVYKFVGESRGLLLPFVLPCVAWIVVYAGDPEQFKLLYAVLLGLFWSIAVKLRKSPSNAAFVDRHSFASGITSRPAGSAWSRAPSKMSV